MATMNVSLPDGMKDWVESRAETGLYANASDYVRDLIRRDQERLGKIAAMQRFVDEGLASGMGQKTPADMLAEARVSLDTAARTIDQPDQFNLALTKSRELLQEVKNAHVLEANVDQLEGDMAVLEKTVNKVITLRPENVSQVYTFTENYPALPFELFSYNKKLYFVTGRGVTGPLDASGDNKSLLP